MSGIEVPVANLMDYNPFKSDIWYEVGKPIKKSDVAYAIKNKRFISTPVGSNRPKEDHIQRIAYLVAHGWNDAIHIDVGIPSLVGGHVDWIVEDGHHRLAAAIYSKRKTIKADISGSIDYAEKLLGVKMENEEPEEEVLTFENVMEKEIEYEVEEGFVYSVAQQFAKDNPEVLIRSKIPMAKDEHGFMDAEPESRYYPTLLEVMIVNCQAAFKASNQYRDPRNIARYSFKKVPALNYCQCGMHLLPPFCPDGEVSSMDNIPDYFKKRTMRFITKKG